MTKNKDWQEEFDNVFKNILAADSCGFDAKPRIKDFIASQIEKTRRDTLSIAMQIVHYSANEIETIENLKKELKK